MSDAEDTVTEGVVNVSEADTEEDEVIEIFGEKSTEVFETIAGNLSRKRVPTSTLLEETSKQAKAARLMDGRRHYSEEEGSDLGAHTPDPFAQDMILEFVRGDDSESMLTDDQPREEVGSSEEVDFSSDFLPKLKVKATQESLGVPEIVKLREHKDLSGDRTSYTTLCENIFTMICCLVCDRVTTSGLTVNEEDKLAMYRRFYYEQCQVCGLDTYLLENLFSQIPDYFARDADGNMEWPAFYSNYVQENYEQKKLTGVQKNRSRTLKKG
jgi:hypothetical protein